MNEISPGINKTLGFFLFWDQNYNKFNKSNEIGDEVGKSVRFAE